MLLDHIICHVIWTIYRQFKKNKVSLDPSHGVLQLLKENFYSVLILHLLRPLFLVFRVFQALIIFVLVNDLYTGDTLEANGTVPFASNVSPVYKGLQCVQTDEEWSLWQLFSCAGVSNDKVVLDSHIVAKQNC